MNYLSIITLLAKSKDFKIEDLGKNSSGNTVVCINNINSEFIDTITEYTNIIFRSEFTRFIFKNGDFEISYSVDYNASKDILVFPSDCYLRIEYKS